MENRLRYAAAACQTDFPNPPTRRGIKAHVDRMLLMIAQAVEGYSPFFPSSWWSSPSSRTRRRSISTAAELLDKLAVPIPNEHTDRYDGEGSRARRLRPDRHVPGARRPLAGGTSSTRRA